MVFAESTSGARMACTTAPSAELFAPASGCLGCEASRFTWARSCRFAFLYIVANSRQQTRSLGPGSART